jgi:hypothetical protein
LQYPGTRLPVRIPGTARKINITFFCSAAFDHSHHSLMAEAYQLLSVSITDKFSSMNVFSIVSTRKVVKDDDIASAGESASQDQNSVE